MPLPRPLIHEVKIPKYKYPVWQISPMTAAERAEVEALLPVLEQRLIPADPSQSCRSCQVLPIRSWPADLAKACKMVEDALKAAKPATHTTNNINYFGDDLLSRPAPLDPSSMAWIAELVAGYSLDTLRASIEFAGVSDLKALSDDLRRRRDNAIIYRYRCRVLLGLQPAQWYEIPGAPGPDGPDKPFDKPVFLTERANLPR